VGPQISVGAAVPLSLFAWSVLVGAIAGIGGGRL
jgi:hypothetical protein